MIKKKHRSETKRHLVLRCALASSIRDAAQFLFLLGTNASMY